MLSYKERRQKFFNQRKKLAIHQWLSTAAITVVAVVAATVLIPKEAYAHFIELETFGNDIYYEVEIVDEEKTISPGTLKIVAQNQLEYHEKDLETGYDMGSFSSLKPNTTYQVSIRAHCGFGEEILEEEEITTEDNYGAAVTNVHFHEDSYEALSVDLDVTYNDLKQELSNIELKVAYQEQEQIETQNDYFIYPISNFQEKISFGIPNCNIVLHLIIEATLIATEEVIVLYDKLINTPLCVYFSIYAMRANTNSIDISAYLDFQITDTITYEIQLISEGRIINRIYPTADQVEMLEYESSVFNYRFSKLKENTHYHLKVIATYAEHQIVKVKEEMVDCYTTLPYDVQVTKTQNGDNMLIDIQITDPNLLLNNFYYTYYEIIDGAYSFISGDYLQLETTDQIHFHANLSVSIVSNHQYEFLFSANINVNNEFIYYWVPFYQEIWNIK